MIIQNKGISRTPSNSPVVGSSNMPTLQMRKLSLEMTSLLPELIQGVQQWSCDSKLSFWLLPESMLPEAAPPPQAPFLLQPPPPTLGRPWAFALDF